MCPKQIALTPTMHCLLVVSLVLVQLIKKHICSNPHIVGHIQAKHLVRLYSP